MRSGLGTTVSTAGRPESATRARWKWRRRRRIAIALAATLAVVPLAHAKRSKASFGALGSGTLVLGPSATLEPVLPAELLPQGRAAAVPADGRSLDIPTFDTQILREIPVLWELRLPPETRTDELRIELELHSEDGLQLQLSGDSPDRPTIRVRVLPTSIREVRRTASEVIVQGGATLELDVDSLRYAGKYRGIMTVHVQPR